MLFKKVFKCSVEYIKQPRKFILLILNKILYKYMKDEDYLKLMYKIILNKELNLKNPETFNEKIQWLKLNDRNLEYTNLVDKYKVREFIADSIGEEYLIPLIGKWENFDDIDFSKLPNKFVLKCTHDSGGIVICKNKNELDVKQAKQKIEKALKRNYYDRSKEWPYKNVEPLIICEKYMEDNNDEDLKDYKFMCFNGEVKCSFVCSNRRSLNGLKVDFYDRDWNFMDFKRHYPNSGKVIYKPKNYEKMILLAEKLSKNFTFVRIDFYEVNEKIYFGEFTLYPGSGFEEFTPEKYDYLLGSWIKL